MDKRTCEGSKRRGCPAAACPGSHGTDNGGKPRARQAFNAAAAGLSCAAALIHTSRPDECVCTRVCEYVCAHACVCACECAVMHVHTRVSVFVLGSCCSDARNSWQWSRLNSLCCLEPGVIKVLMAISWEEDQCKEEDQHSLIKTY